MSAAETGGHDAAPLDAERLAAIVARVVRARMGAHPAAADVAQEALTRVLGATDRIAPEMLEPYAVATARNLVASTWRDAERFGRHRHRLADHDAPAEPHEGLLAAEDRAAMARALAQFEEEERELLIAHEVEGVRATELAGRSGATPAALAARLHRLRARLRVEYLLAAGGAEPPTDRCRPVLYALSLRERRRQRESGTEQHLLECPVCAGLRAVLQQGDPDLVRVPIGADPDIVRARQTARESAARLGFSKADLTVIATAVSELARNIVRFGGSGEIVIDVVGDGQRSGLRVVARDAGPGIEDVEAAMRDGYSTTGGLGLGLPGVRRLTDEFELVTRLGHGTTITCVIWEPGGRP